MTFEAFSPQILSGRKVIRITGEGGLAFLQNLLTVDLSDVQPAYGALLTPQGKILHDVFVVPDGLTIWLDVAGDHAADLLKRLMMYRLRARLELVLDEGKAVAVSSTDELPGLSYVDPRTNDIGHRAIVDALSLPEGTGYDAARIAVGLADSVLDIGSGEMFVHEANLDQLNGVSFSKGCYVGQEVVSRVHHRHTARKRILPVRFEGEVQQGAEIKGGGARIGTMLSSRNGHGLALLRLDRLAEASAPLTTGDVTLNVHRPQWATFDMVIPH